MTITTLELSWPSWPCARCTMREFAGSSNNNNTFIENHTGRYGFQFNLCFPRAPRAHNYRFNLRRIFCAYLTNVNPSGYGDFSVEYPSAGTGTEARSFFLDHFFSFNCRIPISGFRLRAFSFQVNVRIIPLKSSFSLIPQRYLSTG